MTIHHDKNQVQWTKIAAKLEKWFLSRSNSKADYPDIGFILGTEDVEL